MKINSDQEDSVDFIRKSSISPINKETLFTSNNFESSELDVDPSISQKKSHEIQQMILARKLSKEQRGAVNESEGRQSILPMHRKLTKWQRIDNWFWMN
jgi:hypothetical protein